MSTANQAPQGSGQLSAETMGPMAIDGLQDPVDAYFECISTCSLDDGACVTVCTEILRDHT